MTDKKISELNTLTTADDADLLAVVDVSATETKQITHLDHHAGIDLVDDTAGSFAARLIAPDATTDALVMNIGNRVFGAPNRSAQVWLYWNGTDPGIFIGTYVGGGGGNAAYLQLDHNGGGPDPGVVTLVGDASVTIQSDTISLTITGGLSPQLVITGLPTSDPGVAGAVYSNGTPSAGVPKALFISGG